MNLSLKTPAFVHGKLNKCIFIGVLLLRSCRRPTSVWLTLLPVCPGAMPGDGVRRRPRSVPRPDGAVQDRRQVSRHQLPVHGRLRRQRLLLCGDGHAARHT